MCGECWESVRSVRGRWEVLGEYGEYRESLGSAGSIGGVWGVLRVWGVFGVLDECEECLGSVRKGFGVSWECESVKRVLSECICFPKKVHFCVS